MQRNITCYCEHVLTVEVPETFNLSEIPEIKDEILEGKFMSFHCENCGTELKPEFPFTITELPDSGVLSFLPELSRDSYLAGTTEVEKDTTEVVIGYPELVEFFRITETDLSRKTLEIVKYFIIQKAPDGTEPVLIFKEISEDDKILFYVYGLKEDEIGITGIPLGTYNKIDKDMAEHEKRDPYKTIIALPYPSVRKMDSMLFQQDQEA